MSLGCWRQRLDRRWYRLRELCILVFLAVACLSYGGGCGRELPQVAQLGARGKLEQVWEWGAPAEVGPDAAKENIYLNVWGDWASVPWVAILRVYENGAEPDISIFETITDRLAAINGVEISPPLRFTLYVNDKRGKPSIVKVPPEYVPRIFGLPAVDELSRETVLKFWNEVVVPQLEEMEREYPITQAMRRGLPYSKGRHFEGASWLTGPYSRPGVNPGTPLAP